MCVIFLRELLVLCNALCQNGQLIKIGYFANKLPVVIIILFCIKIKVNVKTTTTTTLVLKLITVNP